MRTRLVPVRLARPRLAPCSACLVLGPDVRGYVACVGVRVELGLGLSPDHGEDTEIGVTRRKVFRGRRSGRVLAQRRIDDEARHPHRTFRVVALTVIVEAFAVARLETAV